MHFVELFKTQHGTTIAESFRHLASKNVNETYLFSITYRLIKATGNTPIGYGLKVKIECAKKAFESNRKTIFEVMYVEVGYSDAKAFREVFRKFTGMSPLEYKGKYHKDAAV